MNKYLMIVLIAMLCACSSQERVSNSANTQHSSSLEQRAKVFWEERGKTLESDSLLVSTSSRHTKRSGFQCANFTASKLAHKLVPVTLSFFEVDIREALVEVSMLTQTPIVVDETVEGYVTANLENASIAQTLDVLLASGGYSYRFFDHYILVGGSTPDSPSFSDLATTCRYKPFHTMSLDLAASLSPYYQQFIRVPETADYITITAPEKLQKSIQQQIRVFDQSADQVLLEMSIIEVSRKALDILGVSWNRYGRDPNTYKMRRMGVGEWTDFAAVSAGGALDAFTIGQLPQRTLADSLQFLTNEGEASLKAMPSIVTLDGKQAQFSTLHNVWLPVINGHASGGRLNELTYGVEMKVVPRISYHGDVMLRIVEARVSDLSLDDTGYPHIVAHQVSNSVSVKDGHYLVLGGLLQTKKRKASNGVPYAKDAPVAGKLFGQSEDVYEEMEVLIMIRPKILQQKT